MSREIKETKVAEITLTCRECGYQTTFTLGHNITEEEAERRIPSHGWNGWFLKDTELCPTCYVKQKQGKAS